MKGIILNLCMLFVCVFALQLHAADVMDNSTGETFPESVSFDHQGKNYKLNATGVATRKKLIVKVYSIVHYLQDTANFQAPDKFKEVMRDDVAKQFTMKYVRNIDAKSIVDAYHESFRNALTPQEYNSVQSDVEQFISFFNREIKKGDEAVIRSVPGGYVEVLFNGEAVGNLTNPTLAKGVWNIWFGSKSPVNKDNLVSLMR